jgi:hypothetical protein
VGNDDGGGGSSSRRRRRDSSMRPEQAPVREKLEVVLMEEAAVLRQQGVLCTYWWRSTFDARSRKEKTSEAGERGAAMFRASSRFVDPGCPDTLGARADKFLASTGGMNESIKELSRLPGCVVVLHAQPERHDLKKGQEKQAPARWSLRREKPGIAAAS